MTFEYDLRCDDFNLYLQCEAKKKRDSTNVKSKCECSTAVKVLPHGTVGNEFEECAQL